MAVTIHAPELDQELTWLNTDHALSLRELRGAVVVLDFWTYCCVNCMHVLPILRAIEERHRDDPVVVIGVHSGKFDAEQDPARIHDAIERYEVEHPVVVDDEMALWNAYAIRSWPTLVVIRPDGTIAAIAPGEPDLDVLDDLIVRELASARAKGTLSTERLPPERPTLSMDGALRYPGKASVLPDGRVVVSDSGHHRVLVCTPDGRVELTIGSGLRGLADGPLAEAAFDDPQGTCFLGGALYIADTRNHALRRVDLERGIVTTAAGTGALGRATPGRRVPGRSIALRSPWDLVAANGAILVAMAGSHQIWRFFPGPDEIEVFAGTGVEALVDGPADESAWAQPSGLSVRGGVLYVADSETSAVRALDLETREVRTVVGEGLFEFGDEDGPARVARLQHPLGVAATEEGVLVADTYNGKIKLVTDPHFGAGTRAGTRAGEVRTLLSGLQEPGSIAVAPDGTWIVADTSAHRLLRVAGRGAELLDVRGASPPARGDFAPAGGQRAASLSSGGLLSEGWFTSLLTLPEGVGLAPGRVEIVLELHAGLGSELAAGAPIRVAAEVSRRSDLLCLPEPNFSSEAPGGPAQPIRVPVLVERLPQAVVEAELCVTIDYVACDARDHGSCAPGRIHVRIPARLLAEGGVDRLSFKLPLPSAGL